MDKISCTRAGFGLYYYVLEFKNASGVLMAACTMLLAVLTSIWLPSAGDIPDVGLDTATGINKPACRLYLKKAHRMKKNGGLL